MKTVKAWHFLESKGHLSNGDSRKVRPGRWLVHHGDLVLCVSGLHASVMVLDALKYALGSVVCRVECSGEITHSTDKLVCTRRRILWWVDSRTVLRQFACKCALDVIGMWDPPDVVTRYLRSMDESLRRDADKAVVWAVSSAARGNARAAAKAAAGVVAIADAVEAAWFASDYAARAAARHVTQTAMEEKQASAMTATLKNQNRRLTSMIINAHRKEK